MTRILAALAVAGALLAGATGTAQAFTDGHPDFGGGHLGDRDPVAFAELFHHFGNPDYTADQAQTWGTGVCHALDSGWTEARVIQVEVDKGVPINQERLAVHGAEFHFCPNHYAPANQ
jgi:hypothetical protein